MSTNFRDTISSSLKETLSELKLVTSQADEPPSSPMDPFLTRTNFSLIEVPHR